MPTTPNYRGAHDRAEADLPCITCGKPLVRRRARETRHTFYGCTGYPSCRTTANSKDGTNQKDKAYRDQRRQVAQRLGDLTTETPLTFVQRVLRHKNVAGLKGDTIKDLMNHQVFFDLEIQDLLCLVEAKERKTVPKRISDLILEGDLI